MSDDAQPAFHLDIHGPDMRFQDQVVVVTGAARGIGFAAAAAFAREGAQVVVNDLDPAAVTRAVEMIIATGGRAFGLPGDVGDRAAVAVNAGRVIAAYGRIDVLVNNAGIMRRAPSEHLDAATWRQVLNVNLDGAFFWSQEVAVRSMIPRRRGAIVNVASMAGLVAVPNAVSYVTSKHAVIGLTKALAVDWSQYNIRVNAVCPGMTVTELSQVDRARDPGMFIAREARVPLGRAAQPAEQAEAILFLASDAAAYMQGSVMVIDGGNIALSSGHSAPRAQGTDDPSRPVAR